MKVSEEKNEVWQSLQNAIKDRHHPFHLLSVAYLGDQVDLCTVVLRNVKEQSIAFHTNVHSKKVKSFHIEPRASILGYDKENKWQIRMKGRVTCHHQNEDSLNAWNKMQPMSKLCYSMQPPGCEIKEVIHDKKAQEKKLAEINDNPMLGYENFVVCEVVIDHIESLHLHHLGHERVVYMYADND